MTAQASRFFAVLPAAGRSRRMGQPKLLLPVGGRPLVAHLLAAWRQSCVARVVAVVRRDDLQLAEVCRESGADVVCPEVDPPDMRTSVLLALQRLLVEEQPAACDYWLLAPADMPCLTALDIDQVAEACRLSGAEIVVPVHDGRRGHPVAFAWPLLEQARQLPPHSGLNALLQQHAVFEAPTDRDSILRDIDTPDDYQQLS